RRSPRRGAGAGAAGWRDAVGGARLGRPAWSRGNARAATGAPVSARRMKRRARRPESVRRDPVGLALDAGLFSACADEIGALLQRASHSPNIKERLDFSCAVFDGRGRLVAQAAHIPVHLGSMPTAVRAALELPMAPGDVVVLNDPYAGGTHLPDITLVSPVFLRTVVPAGTAPAFLLASRAHHADVGGGAPGARARAGAIDGGGLLPPPVHLVKTPRHVEGVWRVLLANVRTPAERAADLLAQLAAQKAGERALLRMQAARGGIGAAGRTRLA